LFRRLWPGLQPLLETLQAIAAERRASQVAVALNWCRAHGALPIPGIRSANQAEAAAEALDWTLSASERQALDALAMAGPARMPANPFSSD
jgi:pyridoxine 4-dehydrogenase